MGAFIVEAAIARCIPRARRFAVFVEHSKPTTMDNNMCSSSAKGERLTL
jgi:hypothetical protein